MPRSNTMEVGFSSFTAPAHRQALMPWPWALKLPKGTTPHSPLAFSACSAMYMSGLFA